MVMDNNHQIIFVRLNVGQQLLKLLIFLPKKSVDGMLIILNIMLMMEQFFKLGVIWLLDQITILNG